MLEEVAKTWKKESGQVIVEGDGESLKSILKMLEGSMSGGRIVNASNLSRHGSFNFSADANSKSIPSLESRPSLDHNASFGISNLEVEDKDEEDELLKDPREWMKVIGAFEQPKLVYNVSKKHFDKCVQAPLVYRRFSLTTVDQQRNHLYFRTPRTRPISSDSVII